jgi:hypothetical protein
MEVRLIDPVQIRLQERKPKAVLDSSIPEDFVIDEAGQRDLMIQNLLDQAFVIRNEDLRDYVIEALKTSQKISTRNLKVDDAQDLLAMAHVIEIGAVNDLSSELTFKVTPTGNLVENSEFYQAYDEFSIELQNKSDV